jgi:hypothetical protein
LLRSDAFSGLQFQPTAATSCVVMPRARACQAELDGVQRKQPGSFLDADETFLFAHRDDVAVLQQHRRRMMADVHARLGADN